jgi:hypothetical protein
LLSALRALVPEWQPAPDTAALPDEQSAACDAAIMTPERVAS